MVAVETIKVWQQEILVQIDHIEVCLGLDRRHDGEGGGRDGGRDGGRQSAPAGAEQGVRPSGAEPGPGQTRLS